MPDDTRPKHPMPKIPDVASFMRQFSDDDACTAHLRDKRWGPNLERFMCPDCGHDYGWWLPTRGLVECRMCHHQTSPTAGTVFHGARVPLWKWFWGYVPGGAQQERHCGHGLGQADSGLLSDSVGDVAEVARGPCVQRCQRYVLQGLVEIDETYVGGREPGRPGRGVEKKVPVAVAVELDEDKRPRRIALESVARVDARSLKAFTQANVKKGSCLRTDGWGSYRSVAKAGYEHEAIVTGGGDQAVTVFPWIHTFIGNMKRMILGTYHSVSAKHLNRYLAAFVYRANRRWMEANLFDRLVIAALEGKPLTFGQLTTGAK